MPATRIPHAIAGLTAACILFAGAAAGAGEGRVEGWILAGVGKENFTIGTEQTGGGTVAYLRSTAPADSSYGVLMQFFDSADYEGRRIRLTARVRPEGVKDFCSLFLRVDRNREAVAFDNMADRPLRGTGDWRACTIVVDVPRGSDTIFLGLILRGEGKAQLDDVELETVGPKVPLTGPYQLKSGPANLDFEE